jgi:hypothetical protein
MVYLVFTTTVLQTYEYLNISHVQDIPVTL